MSILHSVLTLFTVLVPGGVAETGVVWDFEGTANPSGANLQLLSGTPAFVSLEGGQGLAAGTTLQWGDAPVLRLRPEIELLCRFRLDALPKNAQVLATKGGEYLLRVDGPEGGQLSIFVRTEGQWEPTRRSCSTLLAEGAKAETNDSGFLLDLAGLGYFVAKRK